MRLSGIHFNTGRPWWSDYLPLLKQLEGDQFAGCKQLNALLPPGLKTESGHSVRFVPSTELGDSAYEYRIYTTGRISTRPDNWHDLFNALVWMRFPRIKLAMNALHYRARDEQHDGCRGKLRDALTLFDECGVIVYSTATDILDTLANRRWQNAFLASNFISSTRVAICGHAMLEKYLAPYKAMTAKALLVSVDETFMNQSHDLALARIDEAIAGKMTASDWLRQPADLSPLPLAGIPGWWPLESQDESFYKDRQVFRPPPAGLMPVQIQVL